MKITITQFSMKKQRCIFISLQNTHIRIYIRNKLRKKILRFVLDFVTKYPGNVGSFGVLIRTWVQGAVCTRNAALKVGCSWLSACIVELGYLVKVPPPSQRLHACTSMHVQELLAHIERGSYVYLLACTSMR